MKGLEAVGVAHSDIAPGNVMVKVEDGDVQLLDLEDLCTPDSVAPKDRITGQTGYIHPSAHLDEQSGSASFTTWCREGDRYATAVLATEMLVLSQPQLAANASDTGFFGGDRTSSLAAKRCADALPFLRSVCPAFADLFEKAWTSETLAACPTVAELRDGIPRRQSAPNPIPPVPRRRWWWWRSTPRHSAVPSIAPRDVRPQPEPSTAADLPAGGVTWDHPGTEPDRPPGGVTWEVPEAGALPARDGVTWETPPGTGAVSPPDSGVKWETSPGTAPGSRQAMWIIGSAAVLVLVAYFSFARSCSPVRSIMTSVTRLSPATAPPAATAQPLASTLPSTTAPSLTTDTTPTTATLLERRELPLEAQLIVPPDRPGAAALRASTEEPTTPERRPPRVTAVPSSSRQPIPPIPRDRQPAVTAKLTPADAPPPAAPVQPVTPAPQPPVQSAPLPPPSPVQGSPSPLPSSLPSPPPSGPAAYRGPSMGTLTYSGPPIVQNGEVVFRNLPPARLALNYDQDVWEARLSPAVGNTQQLILRNKKPGTQKKCVVNWRVIQ
jgi:hypothetical protein